MEFEFDEDQRLLQQSVRETLAKIKDQPEDQLWATYLELGWAGGTAGRAGHRARGARLHRRPDTVPGLGDLVRARWPGGCRSGSGTGVFDGTGQFVLDADRAGEVALLTASGVRIVPGAGARHRAARHVRPPAAHRARHGRGTRLAPGVPDLALMGLASHHGRRLPQDPRPRGRAREAAAPVRRADRLVPGRQAQGRRHVRRDRAGPRPGLLQRADHRRGPSRAHPGGSHGQGGRRRVPAGRVRERLPALRRDGLHLGERAARSTSSARPPGTCCSGHVEHRKALLASARRRTRRRADDHALPKTDADDSQPVTQHGTAAEDGKEVAA